MKHLFYLMAIVFIYGEILWIFHPKDEVKKRKKYRSERKKNEGKSWDEYTKEYKDLLKTTGMYGLLTTIWMFVGLLSFNWVAFLTIILWNFIIIAPISKLTKESVLYTIIHWFNSVIGFCFAVFVIVNSYHLKINLYEWFINYFNY